MKKKNILDVQIDDLTLDSALSFVSEALSKGDRCKVYTPNPEIVLKAQDKDYLSVLNSGDLLLPDGVGLFHISLLLGTPFVHSRITGVDFSLSLAKLAQKHEWRVFLLGGAVGVSDLAAKKLQSLYPLLQIVGTYSDCTPSPSDSYEIIRRINDSGADIVLVAFGAPAQEQWIHDYSDKISSSVFVGVGGTFDYIAEIVPRAPRYIRILGFEWLYRLVTQPQRFLRIMRAVFVFTFVYARWRLKGNR